MGFFKKQKKKFKKSFNQARQGARDITRGDFKAGLFNLAGAGTEIALSGAPGTSGLNAKIETRVGGLLGLAQSSSSSAFKVAKDAKKPLEAAFPDPIIAAQEAVRKEEDKRKKRAGARVLTSPLSRLVAQSQSTRVLTGQ